ncbi:MAG: hypothetical protein H7346_13245 [Burkholderiaceae bacterium]|nr:hypothetical protein [Burkholderiaceae bacterium]
MPGEIIAVVAQASVPSSAVDSPVLRSVSEADEARLADLLSARDAQASQAAQPVEPPAADVQPLRSNNTMGDAMLRNLDTAGRSYTEMNAKIYQALSVGGSNLNTTDLLRIQLMLVDSSMKVDMISKGISKATQEIDQLTKLQ